MLDVFIYHRNQNVDRLQKQHTHTSATARAHAQIHSQMHKCERLGQSEAQQIACQSGICAARQLSNLRTVQWRRQSELWAHALAATIVAQNQASVNWLQTRVSKRHAARKFQERLSSFNFNVCQLPTTDLFVVSCNSILHEIKCNTISTK